MANRRVTDWSSADEDKLAALYSFHATSPKKWELIGLEMGKAAETCRSHWRLHGTRIEDGSQSAPDSTDTSRVEYKDNNIYVVQASRRVMSQEELMEAYNIDPTKWRVEKYTIRTSEGYRKDRKVSWHVTDGRVSQGDVEDTGKMLVVPLYHMELRLIRKEEEIRAHSAIDEMIADAKEFAPRYPKIKYAPSKGKMLYEIAMPDIHFGRLTWHEESGEDFDIKIAEYIVRETLSQLLQYSKNFEIGKILLPLGNDYFNVNNMSNTTVKGTLQQEDTRWQKTFRAGRRMATEMIDACVEIAPTDVMIVAGNHDCYSSDTEVLTNTGWKNYKMLLDADLVATINRYTKEVEYQPFTNLVEYDYSGAMYSFKNRYTDVLVSPNHRMLYRRSWEDDYSYATAETLSEYSVYHFRISGTNTREDYPIDDNWLRLFAWINTDGSINSPISYTINQSKKTGCDKIENVLSALGLGHKKTVRERAIKVICGRVLKNTPLPCTTYELNTRHTSKEQLNFIFSHLPDKYRIPAVLFQCSERQADIYISSFVDGDGTRKADNSAWAMVYGEEELLSDLQRLLVENQYSAHLNFYRNHQCRIYLNKGYVNAKMKPSYISKVQYAGKIWCLQVPNSNFVTRRNGKIAIHGNSERTFYLGDALECWYRNSKNVHIDNSAMSRKYYAFGKVLLGFTHGNTEATKKLPNLMQFEVPKLWGDSVYREWHTGDKHHKTDFVLEVDEQVGIVIRILRSLAPADAWTFAHGFVGSQRAAEAFLWHPENGLIAQFTAGVDKKQLESMK